ncbi:hypothetical protein [Ramlibacter rhizophilus]|uniref:hypothetical protein n=1 Tax=Ramlibacter rhizophilus TaxID=1781167 RepID=UPI0014324BF9|nr:hypothetical protein [Ramlibacter rhizophilus]
MGNRIVTEADRRATPRPAASEGHPTVRHGTGQKVSRERGSATRNKKNAGKRPRQGGS